MFLPCLYWGTKRSNIFVSPQIIFPYVFLFIRYMWLTISIRYETDVKNITRGNDKLSRAPDINYPGRTRIISGETRYYLGGTQKYLGETQYYLGETRNYREGTRSSRGNANFGYFAFSREVFFSGERENFCERTQSLRGNAIISV